MNLTSDHTTITPTVFVIDDDRYVLESIFETLRVTALKVECFSSALEFLGVVDRTTSEGGGITGCVITDVKLPEMSGVQLQRELLERGKRIPVIVISGQGDIPTVRAAMKLGALDFLEKPFEPRELRELVLQGVENDAVQLRNMAQQKRVSDLLAKLTAEERQVVNGIVDGKTAKVICKELDLSLRTIQFRRSSAMQKLNTTRAELVEIVLRDRDATAGANPNAAYGDVGVNKSSDT